MAKEVEKDIDVMAEQEFSLSGGDFFKKNPAKLLAEPYEGSGRFGPVTKYRAKAGKKAIDVLAEIDTPTFIAHGITDISAGASVIKSPDVPAGAPEKETLAGAIEESKKNIVSRQRSEKKKLQDFEEPEARPTIPFEDIVRTYNKTMSEDEIKVFLWYMHQQGNTYRGKWLNIFNPTILSQEQEAAYIKNWVKSGLLFYFRSELLPAFIYFSESVYERKSQIEKDRDDIIKIYGEEAYKAQEAKLAEVFSEVYNSRLKLDDPDPNKRMKLKPYGDFTDSITIKNWNLNNETGEPNYFLVPPMKDNKLNWYSRKSDLSDWRDAHRDELSINDAFKWWLKFDPSRPEIPHNFDYEDIFKYYLDKKIVKLDDPTVVARNRALAKEAGDKLFSRFLAEVILENDRVRIETEWNERFNGSRGINTDKIPIGFECALYYPGDQPLIIMPEKREAVAFAQYNGSSLNAFQVGVGKTFSASFTIEQFLDAEHCRRPVLVVPNQVYKQFFAEMHGLLPHRTINDLYNLSGDYYDKLLDENGKVQAVQEGSITMLTYEGFMQIGFNDETANNLVLQLDEVITQIKTFGSEKQKEKANLRREEKLRELLGKALQKTRTNIEDLGFDFICFDEAHALKNIFSSVSARESKEEVEEGEKKARPRKRYELQGSASTRGIKAYMICSYIQLQNRGRNILLLTATPFTNNPLEVYSMLSLVAYQYLKKIGLSNINDFFDNYCNMTYELIINSRLQPVRKEVFKSFDNLQSLQKLIYQFMLHKEAGKPDRNGRVIPLIRPDKWVLPYKGRYNQKNEFLPATPDEMIDTKLSLTDLQKELMEEVIQYVEEKISFDSLKRRGEARQVEVEDDEGTDEEKEARRALIETLLDEGSMNDDEKKGVRVLRGVNLARSLALSPYLYPFSGLGEPDYKSYVEKSPKLRFIMECIASVKKWHESKKEAVSGQVIYMDRGKDHFELLKEYLVKVVGYKPHEIGIIRSGKEGQAIHKENTKNGFNGIKFDDRTKSFSNIPDAERIKIIIGTSSIREGMNLQRYGTVLYNGFVDWNPTDQIQLEGRMWRQGNTFANVRIVIPMMADSMDIFMFQKLEEKTSRINSIWNYDGQSNVLKVEELDPNEMKKELITDPKVIAQIEVEDEEAEISEKIASEQNNIDTAQNLIRFFEKRDDLEKQLGKILSILEPGKKYPSIDTMIKDFERLLSLQDEDEKTREAFRKRLESGIEDRYQYEFLTYDYELQRPWSYGQMKGSVAALKRARNTFFSKYHVAEEEKAVEAYIAERKKAREHLEKDKERLSSDEYISERAREIEDERKKKKIKFVPLGERVKEFEKLNYLLGLRSDKTLFEAEEFIYTEIEGCPPVTSGDIPDVSPEGIKKLEICLEKIPQTKALYTDETGEYTDKRKKLHEDIKAKLRSGLRCTVIHEKPVAIFIAGAPGGGKTTFLRKYAPNLSKEKIFKIDADEIRTMLPEYKGWNATITHKETQDIYRSLLKDMGEGKPCRFDILWDGTMNKAENYLPLIGDLKHLGYEIYMIYVEISWELSRKRTLDRYVKESQGNKFGRYIPIEVVDTAHKQGMKGFNELKTKADGYMVVNGATGEIIEKSGQDILADRGYFDRVPTEIDIAVEKAKAIAIAQKQKIAILKLKAA